MVRLLNEHEAEKQRQLKKLVDIMPVNYVCITVYITAIITSTSKVLRSCSTQIFVNVAKKNIFELLTFLLETNL